jgi:hypothetical protein
MPASVGCTAGSGFVLFGWIYGNVGAVAAGAVAAVAAFGSFGFFILGKPVAGSMSMLLKPAIISPIY